MKTISFLLVAATLTILISYSKTDGNTLKQSMRPQEAEIKLEERIQQSGTPKTDLTLAQGVRLMLDFYRDVRAQGVDLNDGGDMLLFQWGIYDFDRTGPTFQCDITRQFIEAGAHDDEGMTQLSFTFHFQPSPVFEKIPEGNKWCSGLNELNEFEKFITNTEAFKSVSGARPLKVSIWRRISGLSWVLQRTVGGPGNSLPGRVAQEALEAFLGWQRPAYRNEVKNLLSNGARQQVAGAIPRIAGWAKRSPTQPAIRKELLWGFGMQ